MTETKWYPVSTINFLYSKQQQKFFFFLKCIDHSNKGKYCVHRNLMVKLNVQKTTAVSSLWSHILFSVLWSVLRFFFSVNPCWQDIKVFRTSHFGCSFSLTSNSHETSYTDKTEFLDDHRTWLVLNLMSHVTCAMWHVTCERWHLKHDKTFY